MWPFDKKNETINEENNPDPRQLKNSILGNHDGLLGDKLKDYQDEPSELQNYHIAAAYSAIYTKVSGTRKEMIKEFDDLRQFYLTEVMIEQLVEDALTPDVVSSDILKISSDKKDIQAEIAALDERLNFDNLASVVAEDLVSYGEYVLKTKFYENSEGERNTVKGKEKDKKEEDGKINAAVTNDNTDDKEDKKKADKDKVGIETLLDNVDQGKVVPLTRISGEADRYLVESEQKLRIVDKTEFIRFTLDNKKIRVDLNNEYAKEKLKQVEDIPRFVRIGKPVLYKVRGKLKELDLLEKLVPATKLSKLASGTLVGVQVPPGMDIGNAIKAVRRIESVINKKVGLDDPSGQLTLESIMASSGKMKAVPIFGDKGQLERMDYQSDEPQDLLSSVEDVRKTICNSAGIPYELIFSEDGGTKGDMLKRYARYLRKLKNLQKALAKGMRQIVFYHLAEKGIPFVETDVEIEFRNKLIEIDNLDKLEFLDTTVGMLNSIKDFLNDLGGDDSPYRDAVDKKAFLKFLNIQLSMVGVGDVIDKDAEIVEPEGDDDFA